MHKGKVGDVVWYVVESTKQQAEVTAIAGSTHATIRLLTGPQAGQELEAPWGIIEPGEQTKVLEILKKYNLHKSHTNEGLDGLTLVDYNNGKPAKSGLVGVSIYWYPDGDWDYNRGYADKTQLDMLRKVTDEILEAKHDSRRRQRNFSPEQSSS